ncbi:MAG: hypothetical protein AAB367_00065 [Patescibacteria group bacterium]
MKEKKQEFIPVSEASQDTPYSTEYVSLLCRKGRIESKKIGRNWYTTKEAVRKYLAKQIAQRNSSVSMLDTYANTLFKKPEAHLASNTIELRSWDDAQEKDLVSPEIKTQKEIPISSQRVSDAFDSNHFDIKPDHKSDTLFEKFIGKFMTFMDISIEGHFGVMHRSWRRIKKETKNIITNRRSFFVLFFFIALLVLSPTRVLLSAADDMIFAAYEKIRDAETLMGHRAGTHANEVLLLDKNGNLAIYGDVISENNIEAGEQLVSNAAEGTAPIRVRSVTKVENLNADFLDGVSSEQMTLAFVTKNGNITYDDVYLEGRVEVGKTLLVKGATHLRQSLKVDGELAVLGDAVFSKNLKVHGDVSARNLFAHEYIIGKTLQGERITATNEIKAPHVRATETLRAKNVLVDGQSVFQGMTQHNGGVWGKFGSFDIALEVGGNFGAYGDTVNLGSANSTEIIALGDSFTFNGATVCTTSTSGCVGSNDSGWTDDGSVVRLTTDTDLVGVGTSTPGRTFSVSGQSLVSGTSTVGNLLVVRGTGTSTFTGGIYTNALQTNLASCDSLDTDASGAIVCGTDLSGGSATPNLVYRSFSGTKYFTASSTVDELAFRFDDGFVSSASSSIAGNLDLDGVLNLSDILNASSTAHITGNTTLGSVLNVLGVLNASSTGHVTGNFTVGGNATSTALGLSGKLVNTSTATSTFTGGIFANAFQTNLPLCDSLDTDAGGAIVCGSDANSGGSPFAWTHTTGENINATTSIIQLSNGFISSGASSSISDALHLTGTVNYTTLTGVGDTLYSSDTSGTLARLAAGTRGTILSMTTGGIPGWVSTSTLAWKNDSATSTFLAGLSAGTGGLVSSDGLTLSGGILNASQITGTSTFGGGIYANDFRTNLLSCNSLDTDSAGAIVCGTDADTTYTAGNNLTLTGTQFAVKTNLYSMGDIFATSTGSSLYASSTVQATGNIIAYASGLFGGTTTPWRGASLAVEQIGVAPSFVVGDSGTSTPFFYISPQGSVGIGTSTPTRLLKNSLDGTNLVLGSGSKQNARLSIEAPTPQMYFVDSDGTANQRITYLTQDASTLIINGLNDNGTGNTNAYLRFNQTDGRFEVGDGGGSFDGELSVYQTGTGDILNLFDSSSLVFTVLNGGSVGIGGTTTPILTGVGDTSFGGAAGTHSDIYISGGLGVGNATTADGTIEVSDRIVIANSGFIGGSKICTAANGICATSSSNPNLVYRSFSGTKYFTASSTVDELAFRFDDGFVSSASSSIAGNLDLDGVLNLSDILNASSTAHITGNTTLGSVLNVLGVLNASSTGHVTGNFTVGGNATSTALGLSGKLVNTSTATSTFTGGIFANAFQTNLPLCDSLDTDAGGAIVCGSDANSGGSPFAWTHTTGENINATTSIIQLSNGFISSGASSSISDALHLTGTVNYTTLTGVGDTLYSSDTSGTLARLAAGTRGTILSMTTGGIPGWVSTSTLAWKNDSATSTFLAGLSAGTGGLVSSDGLTLSGGILNASQITGTSTFGGGLVVSTGGIDINLESCTSALETDSTGSIICGSDENSIDPVNFQVSTIGGQKYLTPTTTNYNLVLQGTNGLIAHGSSTFASTLNVGGVVNASSTAHIDGNTTLSNAFFWDASNQRLSLRDRENAFTVGGVNTGSVFSVHAEGAADLIESSVHRHSDVSLTAPNMVLLRSRGTDSAETAVQDGDTLGIYAVYGYDGTDYEKGAQIRFDVSGTSGAGDLPTVMRFLVSPDGSGTPVERLRIMPDGKIGIGTTSPARRFSVEGDSILTGSLKVGPIRATSTIDVAGVFNASSTAHITGNAIFGAYSTTTLGIDLNGKLRNTSSATSTFTGGIFANAFQTNLPSCDSLDTNSSGALICGTDNTGITVIAIDGDTGSDDIDTSLSFRGGRNITSQVVTSANTVIFSLDPTLLAMSDIFATTTGASVYASSTVQSPVLIGYSNLFGGGTTSQPLATLAIGGITGNTADAYISGGLGVGNATTADGVIEVSDRIIIANSGFISGSKICTAANGICSGGSSNPNLIYRSLSGTKYYTASSTVTNDLSWHFNNGFVSSASSSIAGNLYTSADFFLGGTTTQPLADFVLGGGDNTTADAYISGGLGIGNATTSDGDFIVGDDFVVFNNGRVGIGTTSPDYSLNHMTSLDQDPALVVAGGSLRLYSGRSPATGIEVADISVTNTGTLILSTAEGFDSSGYIAVRPEDDQWGFLVYESDGSSVTDAYLNTYVVDGTAFDYTNFNTSAGHSDIPGFVLTSQRRIGVGSSSPWGLLSVTNGGINPVLYGLSVRKPLFVVADDGTSTPFIFTTQKGVTSFGSSSPSNLLLNIGDVVIGRNGANSDLYVSGGLGIGNATTADGLLETSGIAYIGGIAKIKGTATSTVAGGLYIASSGGGLRVGDLNSCDVVATDATGALICDTDNTGGSSIPNLVYQSFSGTKYFTASSTVDELAFRFDDGFVSSASSSIAGNLYTSADFFLGGTTTQPLADFVLGGGDNTTADAYISGGLGVGNATTSDGDFVVGNDFYVYNNGRVGIGTSTPRANLHLTGGSFLQTPTVSTEVAAVSLSADVVDTVVVGEYAYLLTGSSLNIIDITDPSAMTEVSSTTITTSGLTGLKVVNNYVYAVSNTGPGAFGHLIIVDVSNPAQPIVVGEDVAVFGFPKDIVVKGDYAYIVQSGASGFDFIKIYDISNPTSPHVANLRIAVMDTPTRAEIQGDYLYVVGTGPAELRVIDISNPTASSTVARLSGVGDDGLFIQGGYLYAVENSSNELDIVDITDPQNPSIASSYTIPSSFAEGGAVDIHVVGGYAFVIHNGFFGDSIDVIDVSNPAAPIYVNGRSLTLGENPTNVFISGRYAYVGTSGDDELKSFDISGIEATSALVHSLDAGMLEVRGSGVVRDGLAVGGELSARSGLFVDGLSSFTAFSTSTSYAANPLLKLSVTDRNNSSIINILDIAHHGTSSQPAAGIGAGLTFSSELSDWTSTSTGQIAGLFTDVTSSAPKGALTFSVRSGVHGVNDFDEAMRIASNGYVGVGTTSPWGELTVNQLSGQGRLKPIFTVASTGTTSPSIFVSQKGIIGFGTSAPSSLLLNPGDVAIGRNGTNSDLYVSGGLGVGNATTADFALEVGTAFYISPGGNIVLPNLLNCNGTSVLDTSATGEIVCGTDATTAGGSAGGWTNDGSKVYLTSASHRLGTGSSTPVLTGNGDLSVGGSASTTADLYVSGGLGVGDATTTDKNISFGGNPASGTNGKIYGAGTSTIAGLVLNEHNAAPTLSAEGAIAVGSIGTGNTQGRIWVQSRGVTFRWASNANTADYSEFFYQGDGGAEEGDIMSISTEAPPVAISNHGATKKSTSRYEQTLLGVVTNPSRGTNYNDPNFADTPNFDMSQYANVGLLGHIITKVSTENGPIAVGDRITSSSIPGVGMKATEEGPYVGVALRAFDGSTGTSTTFTYINEENGVSETREVNVDKILVFVQLGWNHLDTQFASASSTEPWVIDFDTGRIKAAYAIDMGGASIENIKAISSVSGNWSIDEDGNMIVKTIEADDIKTKGLRVGESGGPSGVTLFDETNGAPYCIKVINGSVATISGSCLDNALQNPPPPPPAQVTPPPAQEETPPSTEIPSPSPEDGDEPAPEETPPPTETPPSSEGEDEPLLEEEPPASPDIETSPPPPTDQSPSPESQTPPPPAEELPTSDDGLGGITQEPPPPSLDEPPTA